MALIKPEPRTITTRDGEAKTYIISRIPAIPAREIVAQYPVSALPRVGDYAVNEAMMLKVLSYVAAIDSEGREVQLTTRTLIDNHVPDFETLAKIEMAMFHYNCSFFADGKVSSFFDGFAQKVQALITKMLTDLSEQSSKKNKPH